MIIEANITWQYKDTESGLIMPWYTLPCLEWLKKQDMSKWNVFEYGAGYSTIWWRANCKNVASVEHSESWAKAMGAHHIPYKERFITACEKLIYDCIVIDSEYWREECAAFAIDYLKPGGYMIIDNWESENYDPKVNEHLFKDWPIQIFKQPNHRSWKTAVLQKFL